MDLLIKHGTWVIVPIVLAVSFVYMHVYPKVYPFLVARSLAECDARQPAGQPRSEEIAVFPQTATISKARAADSRI